MLIKNIYTYILTFLVFCSCLFVGFQLSAEKPLWNDEILSQVVSVEKRTYPAILFGDYPHKTQSFLAKIYHKWISNTPPIISNANEANRCPLFYLIQKSITQLAHYSFPNTYAGSAFVNDPTSQMILRIQPIVLTSLTIALIFLFLSRTYNIFSGIYGLLLLLSSPILWIYWAEARFYALWIFLTTLQCLIFILIQKHPRSSKLLLPSLIVVNILLALTVIASVFQILAVSLILLLQQKKFTSFLTQTVIPVLLCFGYYFLEPSYSMPRSGFFLNVIFSSFHYDQLLILTLFTAFLIYTKYLASASPLKTNLIKTALPYWFLLIALLACALTILSALLIKSGPSHTGHAGIFNRYFVFLLPAGILSTAVFVNTIIQNPIFAYKKRDFLILFFACLLIIRITLHCPIIFKTLETYLYTSNPLNW